jgi:putative acetyltransferase
VHAVDARRLDQIATSAAGGVRRKIPDHRVLKEARQKRASSFVATRANPGKEAQVEAIEIRRACPDDAAALARVFETEEVFGQLMQLPFPNAQMWRKRLEAAPESGRADIHVVGILAGEVVGSAGLHTVEPMVRRRHAMLLGICVARAAHGRGVGSALMAALTDYADRWVGALRIELTVWADNERAIHLYRKFGFEVEGRMRAYGFRDGRYDDAVAMARLNPRRPALVV